MLEKVSVMGESYEVVNVRSHRIFEQDTAIFYRGYNITIDKTPEFAITHKLPKISRVVSRGGKIFDVYMGIAKNALGGTSEFACAVEIAHLI